MASLPDGFRISRKIALTLTMATALGALAFGLISCGGSDDSTASTASGEPAGDTTSSTEPAVVRLAVTSGATLGDVPGVQGAVENGEQFGIDPSEDNIKRFDSHATAMQVLLSGRAEVISGSFISNLKLMEQGRDIKVFCGVQNATEENVVGTGDIDSLEDLNTSKNTLAIDSPGGAANFFLNFYLYSVDAGFYSDDIENVTILEDGDQRLTAMQNGEATSSVLAFNEIELLKKQIGAENVNVISVLAEDIGDQAIYIAFAAESSWLEKNPDIAARYCAAAIATTKSISDDYAAYAAMLKKYMKPAPPESDSKQLWDLNSRFTVWPDTPVISEEQYNANVEVGIASGLLEEKTPYDKAIARDVMDKAQAILDEGGASE